MKIEKINDNQIRCTLTRADLDDRHLKLSELACGSDKAKSLFHDMMQQAAFELGFETDDMPLMIEAMPASSGSVVLIITKVEDPDELENRFSKFGASPLDAVAKALEAAEAEKNPKEQPSVRLFSFGNLDGVIEAAALLAPVFNGGSTLYKETKSGFYLMALHRSDLSASAFNSICNILTEYGSLEKTVPGSLAYLEEHCELIVSETAVQTLAAVLQ